MHSLLLALATTPAPAPTPSLRPGLSQDQVTPGLLGFLLTAFIVVLTALLIVDMVRRIRRVRYRAQVEEERAAAAATMLRKHRVPSPTSRTTPASPAAVRKPTARQDPETADGRHRSSTPKIPTFAVGARRVGPSRRQAGGAGGAAAAKVGKIRAGGRVSPGPAASAQDGDGNRDVVRGEGKHRQGMEQLMETEV